MDANFWLDNVLSACAALCGVMLVYGAWLSISDLVEELREWLARRLRTRASEPVVREKEG